MKQLLPIICFGLLLVEQTAAQDDAELARPTADSVSELVKQLGHADFHQREAAEKELIKLATADPNPGIGAKQWWRPKLGFLW